MTDEEFLTIKKPVGMTFWLVDGNRQVQGVCLKTFKCKALMQWGTGRMTGPTEMTAYLHCRQLSFEKREAVKETKVKPQKHQKYHRTKSPRPVKDLATGLIYKSSWDAARDIGVAESTIWYWCREGKESKGHKFVYITEEEYGARNEAERGA